LFSKLITAAQSAITDLGPRMIFSITRFILLVFITFFILYYLLINSGRVITTFKDYFPISYANCNILLDEMGKRTKALILGQLLVAIVQGVLGGAGFFICGIPGAILWGLVMVIVSFIPFFGAGLVWFPASIIQLVGGHYYSGIGILLWGALIVSTIDNIIRPKLTSALGKIHPVTVLLGVFIGLKEWGFIGLVIGPLMISVLLILIRMFREEYIDE
jgi:predicted PurR-regulated permease PerM